MHGFVGLGRAWVGLAWAGLGCFGLVWTGLDSDGSGWIGLHFAGLGWIALELVRLGWDGVRIAIWVQVGVEVLPSILFLHICSLEVYRMASWWRANESEQWWEAEDGWAQQWQKKAAWPKFEDELTTRMFTMFDSNREAIHMLNSEVDAVDDITERLNMLTDKVDVTNGASG